MKWLRMGALALVAAFAMAPGAAGQVSARQDGNQVQLVFNGGTGVLSLAPQATHSPGRLTRPIVQTTPPALRVVAPGPGSAVWIRSDDPVGAAVEPQRGPVATIEPVPAVRELFFAWVVRDRQRLDSLLAPDYRFFSDDTSAGLEAEGLTRDDELRILEHMANGFVNAAGTAIPPVTRMSVTVRSFELAADRADGSMRSSARVVAHGVLLVLENADGVMVTEARDHTFLLVRDERAAFPQTDRSPAAHLGWRIARWWEGAPLAGTEAVAAARIACSAAPTAGVTLAVRRLSGTRAWPVRLELSLPDAAPARVRLFDVQGRVVEQQTLAPAAPGSRSLTIGDAAVRPGVYFVELDQAGRSARLKLVVLR